MALVRASVGFGVFHTVLHTVGAVVSDLWLPRSREEGGALAHATPVL